VDKQKYGGRFRRRRRQIRAARADSAHAQISAHAPNLSPYTKAEPHRQQL